MKNILLACTILVGALFATSAFAQDEDKCITKQEVLDYYVDLQATSVFEDSDTLVIGSPLVPSYLENEFDAAGCLTTQTEIDGVHFSLKYSAGV